MKQSFRKITSFFLLAIFVIASTPDYWIHSFADHHDTIDSNSPVTAVGNQHIHCEALQQSLPSFSGSSIVHFSTLRLSTTALYFDVEILTLPFFPLSPSGRAPPALA